MIAEELIETVTGYANGFDRALEETGSDDEQMKEWLLDHNVEQCPDCQWWVDSSELLTDEDEIDGHCCNCRE